ncbi:MAG: NAD-dependent epimerase/dehydratase family protein [Opitutales bacterium]
MSNAREIRKVLVTGAAGRFGREVVQRLHASGFEVRASDQKTTEDLPVPVVIEELSEDLAGIRLCEGMDAVVHLGNIPTSGLTDDQRTFNINVRSNFNVYEGARQQGVRRVIFASSIQVIGGKSWIQPDEPNDVGFELPMSERTRANPGNAYALSKQVGEESLKFFCEMHGLEGIALRLPWLRSTAKHAQRSLRKHLSSRRPRMPDYAAWVFRSDAARLVERCLQVELPGYRVYLPSSRENIEALPLETFYQRWYSGTKLSQPLETLDSLVDISTIVDELGWEPTPLQEAVRQMEASASR